MRHAALKTIAMVLATHVVACSGKEVECEEKSAATTLPSGKEVPAGTPVTPRFSFSDVEYLTASSLDQASIKAHVAKANDFYFRIAAQLGAQIPKSNFVFSPLSVQTAFGLLYPATESGSTSATELASALGFDADPTALAAAMHAHQLTIEQAFADAPAGKTLKYSLVNQVWTDESFGLQQDYLDTIKKYYNSGVGTLPLRSASESSRVTMNAFVAHNTEGLIKDLIPEGVITSDTAAVLTNSVYMLAHWQTPFEKKNTGPKTFNNADGTVSQPETMNESSYYPYFAGDGYQALSLKYVGGRVAMLVVLPETGADIGTFAAEFDRADFDAAIAAQEQTNVVLSLPKFKTDWGTTSLKEALRALGLVAPFEATDNHFPKLLAKDGQPAGDVVWIQDVFHKANIIVDEKGTEAAAATAIVTGEATSAPGDDPVRFTVDRPALYFIYETTYGGILFAGRLAHL